MSAHWFVPQRATKLILLHQIKLIPHILIGIVFLLIGLYWMVKGSMY